MARTRSLAVIGLALALGLALATTGCSATTPEPEPDPAPVDESTDPAAGLRLAPGLYDQADGTVLATGVLEYQDLEGGFWAVIDTTQGQETSGQIVAVIANGADFAGELQELEGRPVDIVGTRLEGASIRMAGPEIEMTSIEEITDTGGIAE